MSADRLEARYRRLLGAWPAAHVERYGEEMVAVLMADSADGQRRPDPREAADLVLSGLRARLRLTVNGEFGPATRSALSLFGVLTAVVAAVYSYREVAATLSFLRRIRDMGMAEPNLAGLPYVSAASAVGWTLVAVFAMVGLRRLAALGAALGAAVLVTHTALGYGFAPNVFVESWWRMVLVVSAAACLVVLARAPRSADAAEPGAADLAADPARPATPRRRVPDWHLLVAGAITVALACVEPLLLGDVWTMTGASVVLIAPLVVPLAIPVLRLAPSVRRRVVLLAAPAAASGLLVATTFGGFLASSPRFPTPVYLVAPQWVALCATPVVVFAVGLWALRRYERRLASGALLA